MSTEQTTNPEADLAALEQRAIDGEPVTPEELAHARERVNLDGLARKGREARQEAEERQAAAERRERAKQAAAALVVGIDERTERAVVDITASIVALISAASDRNQVITEAAGIFDRAGLPVPNDQQTNILEVPGLDHENYVRSSYGEVKWIHVAGVTYRPIPVATKVRDALTEAIRAANLGRTVEIKS
jgi:hypothetical protein